MVSKTCAICNQKFNAITFSKCPNPECDSKGLSSKTSKLHSKNEIPEPKANNIHVAVQSAKIVNAYGTYIQVFGIAIGALILICGIWIGTAMGNNGVIAIGGVLIGLVVAGIFAVQGAVFRMISNYIIASLES